MHGVLLLKYELSGGMLGVVSCSARKGFIFVFGRCQVKMHMREELAGLKVQAQRGI